MQEWKNGRVIEEEVSVDDIWWNGDDINEWGFDDGKGYAYKNVRNNRKLDDLITRDDNGNVIAPSERFNSRKSDVRFRDDEDVYDAGRRSLEETLTQGLIDLANKNKNDVGLRISAMKSISSNLSELRSAMSRQRDYDKSTVNRIVRWARMLMESGIGGNLTRYEVKRLTGMIAQAAGKEDITRQAGQVMDLLINNQLRASKELLQKQMRIKGSKIDARGVEVQGALDIRGQRMIGAFKEGISLGEDAFFITASVPQHKTAILRTFASPQSRSLSRTAVWHSKGTTKL